MTGWKGGEGVMRLAYIRMAVALAVVVMMLAVIVGGHAMNAIVQWVIVALSLGGAISAAWALLRAVPAWLPSGRSRQVETQVRPEVDRWAHVPAAALAAADDLSQPLAAVVQAAEDGVLAEAEPPVQRDTDCRPVVLPEGMHLSPLPLPQFSAGGIIQAAAPTARAVIPAGVDSVTYTRSDGRWIPACSECRWEREDVTAFGGTEPIRTYWHRTARCAEHWETQ